MSDIDYRGFDSEKPSIQRGTGNTGRKLGMIALFGGGALAVGLLLFRDYAARSPDLLARDKNETFSVPQSPMPQFEEKPTKLADKSDILRVDPPPAAPAAPLQPSGVDPNAELAAKLRLLEEQRRLDEERAARARREAEERAEKERLARLEALRQERIRSPLLVIDKEDAEARAAALAAANGGVLPVKQEVETDPNRAFLAQASNRDVEVAKAHKLPRTDALVPQGTLIHGTLDVAIQSDLPGMIRATTSDNVWSFDGRRILIPKGSRLIGEYKSGLVRGQSRVFVVWTRMLDAESKTSVQLGSIGTDDLGRAGLTGEIDKHYFERFGSAVLLSIIGGGAQFIAGLGQNQNSTTTTSTQTYDPATGRYTTVQTQPNQNQQNARQIGAQQISQTLTTLAQDALKDSINIPPTIHIDQGTRIEIFVKRDLDFSALFPDPVRVEAMRLRRGGAPRYDVDPTPAPIYVAPVPLDPPVYLSQPRAIVRKP